MKYLALAMYPPPMSEAAGGIEPVVTMITPWNGTIEHARNEFPRPGAYILQDKLFDTREAAIDETILYLRAERSGRVVT